MVRYIVKLPAAATAFTLAAVASFVAMVQWITLDVVQSEFVTTRDVAAAAKFTDPLVLLIVCAPVVPPAVMVFGNVKPTVKIKSVVLMVARKVPPAVKPI